MEAKSHTGESIMKTIRRDKLARDIQKGLYLATCRYDFNGMTDGPETGDGQWRPARIRTPKYEFYTDNFGRNNQRCIDHDQKPGFCNFDASDFKSSVGYACYGENGIINFTIHSNCCYELKRVA